MKKPFITRKNLIAIAIAALFAILYVFVGLCLTATKDTAMSPNNPFLGLAKLFGFRQIALGGTNGYVTLILTGVYILVLVIDIVYIHRYRVMNRMKKSNPKIILAYIISIIIVLGVSAGLTILLNVVDLSALSITFELLGQTLFITTLVGFALAIVITAICFLIVNFKKVNEPYVFFDEETFDDMGEIEGEADANVTSSFDVDSEATGSATVNGGDGSGNATIEQGARELDDREKVFPGLMKIDVKYDGYEVESVETDDLSLEELVVRFRNYLAKHEKLYYDIDTLRIFISGLNATRLSILEGLSGTGKSSLPRYFAKFVNANVTFLPVQVSWRDKTSILGYFNDFAKTYNETDFLLRLYEANYNPDQINLFVLDEMNISRIEYYFADFLSVLEYPSEQWKIRIMQLPFEFIPPAKLEDGFITIPENSYFIGTANKDDSTFSIAEKVYDRSTVIAFDNRNEAFEVKGEAEPIQLSYSKLRSLFDGAVENEANQMKQADYDKLFKITSYIYDEFEVAFGNRTMNQIDKLVPVFVASGGKKENALDFVLARKVLIKLEGRFEEFVKPALKHLIELLDETYGEREFLLSRKVINSLIRKL